MSGMGKVSGGLGCHERAAGLRQRGGEEAPKVWHRRDGPGRAGRTQRELSGLSHVLHMVLVCCRNVHVAQHTGS